LQVFTQAVVSAIGGLYFYGQSIRRLGASRAAVITSFTPVAVALLGIPLLREFPATAAVDRHPVRERRRRLRERRSGRTAFALSHGHPEAAGPAARADFHTAKRHAYR
jgi:hypothetical protein